jgi:hypothetical protein
MRRYGEGGAFYYTAEVCHGGHPTTSRVETSPESRQKFCSRCGEPTITACPGCNEPIRGSYEVPGVGFLSGYHAPAYCQECGKPFPWTEARLRAARELVDLERDLDAEQARQVKADLSTIATDSPAAKVAATRLSRLWSRVSGPLKDATVEIATEAAKKILLGP